MFRDLSEEEKYELWSEYALNRVIAEDYVSWCSVREAQ